MMTVRSGTSNGSLVLAMSTVWTQVVTNLVLEHRLQVS
ncbi:hypothetical protein MTR67_043325 [Solanum verrucosum]|uniref:Uncharacterized protein n=1 Tax=Solanum verrucosum TaxID=315347 RepID=A0AAF0ZUK9_SOLVR|nr:hypothetical protein MTR67_043325 [Solanum verrucosum]